MKKSTNVKLTGFLCAATILASGAANAQIQAGKGYLSGSLESNTVWYVPDKAIYNDFLNPFPENRIGSNNYLKFDYSVGKFKAGLQFELYAPALQGYVQGLKGETANGTEIYGFHGGKITGKYISWVDDNFSVIVGDFFEQYGSGLILRSYEDRALGFNNSIEGVRITYNYSDILGVKAMAGRPRLYMDYADSWLYGADLSLAISSLVGMENGYLAIEGSYLSQYDSGRSIYKAEDGRSVVSNNMDAWSARLAFEMAGFNLRFEYAGKSPDAYNTGLEYEPLRGSAQLLELGYSGHGWGVALAARNYRHMQMKLIEPAQGNNLDIGNVLNYIPSLTRIYTYSLANLDHYMIKPEYDETAGQLDVFYNVPRRTSFGGRYGMKFHVNAALAYWATEHFNSDKKAFANLDASLDVEKQWTKKWKTTFMFAFQRMRGTQATSGMLPEGPLMNRYTIVADILHKFDSRNALRLELQYLAAPFVYSNVNGVQTKVNDVKNQGDWWAVTAEYSFAPRFSVFAGDMYNYQTEKVHYYNAGVSYTKGSSRLALSYGRNRAGFICSGGVCRQIPGYTGATLTFTSSF